MSDAVSALAAAIGGGAVEVVDLTQPLSESTPVIQLPPPFANTPGLKVHRISAFDEPGPFWAWNWLEIGEHVGTHFDAPSHWISGRDKGDLGTIPAEHLVGPACVMDITAESAANADHLVTVADLEAWQATHGAFPEGGWLLLRTGWDVRAHDQAAFLNVDEQGPHSPGLDAEAAQYISEQTPLRGFGVETVGIDAGCAGGLQPPFPVHYYLLGAGRYGITQLANVARLPATGALLVVAPMKLVGGTGSPVRVLALVPR